MCSPTKTGGASGARTGGAQAIIFTQNYGEAGAIDWFGPALGLPAAVSAHNSYFTWYDPAAPAPRNLLLLGSDYGSTAKYCDSLKVVGHIGVQYAMPHEKFDLLYCRGLRGDWWALWPGQRHFI